MEHRDLDVDALFGVAQNRRHFNVYICHEGDESASGRALAKAGFQQRYVLSQMCGGDASPGQRTELRLAPVMAERVRLAEFMASQFFTSQPAHVQHKIAKASAEPADLQLYEAINVEVRRGPLGAVMLHHTRGVVGLYNLCVALPYRARGFGGAIVRAVQVKAEGAGALGETGAT